MARVDWKCHLVSLYQILTFSFALPSLYLSFFPDVNEICVQFGQFHSSEDSQVKWQRTDLGWLGNSRQIQWHHVKISNVPLQCKLETIRCYGSIGSVDELSVKAFLLRGCGSKFDSHSCHPIVRSKVLLQFRLHFVVILHGGGRCNRSVKHCVAHWCQNILLMDSSCSAVHVFVVLSSCEENPGHSPFLYWPELPAHLCVRHADERCVLQKDAFLLRLLNARLAQWKRSDPWLSRIDPETRRRIGRGWGKQWLPQKGKFSVDTSLLN